ncbi:hypothetical protein TW65_05880 [Stemphylium lycopersici]|nr:hypothetical protein TW65_05880 [Stemphylium lycopersici]
MADIGAALFSELTRVIECPYPPSLSPLSDLLARANVPTIRACIQGRSPCALDKLAKIVRDALPLTAYTLRVLHRLCNAPEFQHELLTRYPGLLNGLLERANSSKQDFNELAELCVLLLSKKLPDAVPLPAAAQNFLLNVFEKACLDPDSYALESVYRMLNGACRRLHRLLPGTVKRRFDSELCRILQNVVVGDSAMLLLWVYGIVLLVEHPQGIQGVQESSASEQPVSTQSLMQQWTTTAGQKLFGSTKNVQKSIQMTCLNVLWLLKAKVEDDEAAEGIRIASRIMQHIDQDVKDSWLTYEKNVALFNKCRSRIEESAMTSTVHLEALSFFGGLSGSSGLPNGITKHYVSSISKASGTANTDTFAETLSVSLPRFAPHVQDIEALFHCVLEACVERPSSLHMSNLISLADELTTATLSSTALRGDVLRTFSLPKIQEDIWNLVRLNLKDEVIKCCNYAASLHRQLVAATIASLLTIALAAEPGELKLPRTLTTALVKKQRGLPHVGNACPHSSSASSIPSISLFQAASTQYTGQHLEDWSTRLDSELESQAKYQRDALLRSVAQICTDLETRCSTVEEPLRREKEKSTKLEEQICRLSDELESLRIQNEDSVDQLEGLEKELEDSREDLDRLRQEKLDITQDRERACLRVKELEVLLEESNRKADDAVQAGLEDFGAKEAELRSMILQREEDIRTRDLETQQLHETINELRQSLAQREADHNTLVGEYELLQHRCTEAEEMLVQERQKISNMHDEFAHCKSQILKLQHSLRDKETALENAMKESMAVHKMHKESRESLEAHANDLVVTHATEMKSVKLKANQDREALENQLQNVLKEIEREKYGHDKTRSEVNHLQEAMPPLEARILELEEFCKEQEEELEERRTIQRNVLAHFGVSSQQPMAIRSTSRSYKDVAPAPTTREPRTHRRRKSAFITQSNTPNAETSAPPVTSSAAGNTANASFESSSSQASGPTPKRSKPRPTFKVPTMHTPYTQKPRLISKSASSRLSPSKRSALRQISPNRRHTVGFAMTESAEEDCAGDSELMGAARRGSLQDLEQVEFDDDDDDDEFMTSAALTPGFMTGTGRVPDEVEEDDVTTTEL